MPRHYESRCELNPKRIIVASIVAFSLGAISVSQGIASMAVAVPDTVATPAIGEQARPSMENAESVSKAANYIVDLWKSQPESFIVGPLTESIIALSSVDLPDAKYTTALKEMLAQLKVLAPDFIGPTDKVANNEVKIEALSKVVIALDAASQDPSKFLGPDRDLVAELNTVANSGSRNLSREWAPYFVTIALGRLGQPIPQAMLDALWDIQDESGAFLLRRVNGTYAVSVDRTAMGISAMRSIANSPNATAAQKAIAEPAVKAAIAWANNAKNHYTDADGNIYWDKNSPAYSTGLLASAMAESGVDVASSQAYLRAQQAMTQGGQGWDFQPNEYSPDLQATTAAVLALSGRGYVTAKSSHMNDPEVSPSVPEVLPSASDALPSASEVSPSAAQVSSSGSAVSPTISQSSQSPVVPPTGVSDSDGSGQGSILATSDMSHLSHKRSAQNKPIDLPNTGQSALGLMPIALLVGVTGAAVVVAARRRSIAR